MASSDSSSAASVLLATPLSPSKKENLTPTQAKIAELNESRTELFSRIQSLKRDLQNWRSNLDTQVKSYREELTEVRKSLNVEVEQLRSEFQELRTTLQQQQEDVTASLRSLGLQDLPGDMGAAEAGESDYIGNNVEVGHSENPIRETAAQESAVEGNDNEIHIS
uniref:Uncharacterized protein n=2 Tax=Opuntia streptacantha TaxID=393608 RepID=A0A7C8ZDV5_OPUST